MTYSIVDSFSQLFRTTSDEYYTTEKINGHIPSASDYSAHLMGQTSLEIVAKKKVDAREEKIEENDISKE